MIFVKLTKDDLKNMKKCEDRIKIKEQQEEESLFINKKPLNYILDTNIIYKIHNDDNDDILNKLKEYASGRSIIFNVV